MAGQDVVEIRDRHVLADVAILGRRLELQLLLLGHRLLGGERHQFAEAQLAIALGVDHFVILGSAFRRRHAPLRSSRAFEHHARGGAGLSHGVIKIANGFGAVRVLAAVFLVADGLLDLHAFPVGFQFLRHNHGQGGADSGAHFRAMRDDDHAAIGFQAEVDAGLPGGVAGGQRPMLRRVGRSRPAPARRRRKRRPENRGG